MELLLAVMVLLFSATAHKRELGQWDEEVYNTVNWTTCEEFLNNTLFDPASLIDIEWQIFYHWNFEYEFNYNLRFSAVTPTLVDRFRVELNDELKHSVNWLDAVLFMESNVDMSGLFLKTNVSGLFKFIPSLAVQYINVKITHFAMKLVEPGYLGIENCQLKFCYALAPSDKMPKPEEFDEAAKKLNFRGMIAKPKPLPVSLEHHFTEDDNVLMDDDDEDEFFEIDRMAEFL